MAQPSDHADPVDHPAGPSNDRTDSSDDRENLVEEIERLKEEAKQHHLEMAEIRAMFEQFRSQRPADPMIIDDDLVSLLT